jgi:hypothetical protein
VREKQVSSERIYSRFDNLNLLFSFHRCAQNTDSKATILRKAVDYILLLEDELRKYTDQYQLQGNGHDPDDGDHDGHN